MATTMNTDNDHVGTVQDHEDNYLANKTEGLSLAEQGQADYDHGLANGAHENEENFKGPYEEEAPAGYGSGNAALGESVTARDSEDYTNGDNVSRPSYVPSRNFVKN
jgi:hypothetical protein